jgi:hypothetical protein
MANGDGQTLISAELISLLPRQNYPTAGRLAASLFGDQWTRKLNPKSKETAPF